LKRFLTAFFIIQFIAVHAQTIFVRKDSVPVFVNNVQLENPWAGGINSAQFSEIDLDQDGTMDLFVFDRSGNKITTYHNNGTPNQVDYKCKAAYISRFPRMHSWVLLRDYNCDGKMDIFTAYKGSTHGISIWKNISTSMNGLQFQLVTDSLLSDYTPNSTHLIQTLAVSNQDIPSIRDVDGDGDLDVLTFDASGIQVEYHRNMSMDLFGVCDSLVYKLEVGCWGEFSESFSGSGVTLFTTCAPVPVNQHPSQQVFSMHAGSCLECIETGNDNDQDVLLGDLNSARINYLQNGGTPLYAQMDMSDDSFPIYDSTVYLSFFPCGFHLDVNNDGKKDVVFSPNSPFSAENFHSCYFYENTNTNTDVDLHFVEKNFMQSTMIDLGEMAYPVFHDYDNDGDKDLFIGNYGYYPLSGTYITGISLYKNTGSSTSPVFNLLTTDFANVHATLPSLVGTALTFGDLDGDGDKDLLIGDFGGKLTYFKKQAGPPDNFVLFQMNYQGIDIGGSATPQLIDVDRDNKIDLLIGEVNGNLNYYRNTGTSAAPVFTLITSSFGNVNVNQPSYATGFSTPCMYDSSGTYVLLVGSERGWLNRYDAIDGNLTGTFIRTDSMYVSTYEGGNVAAGVCDLDNDGLLDVAMGNVAGGVSLFYGYSNVPNGIIAPEIISFNLFPNPANDLLTIATNGKAGNNFRLALYDLSGKIIYSQNLTSPNTTIDISAFAQGIYLCTLVSDDGISVNRKLVISR
jgi:hypothetical protein